MVKAQILTSINKTAITSDKYNSEKTPIILDFTGGV